jgi:hypothetical protein
LHETGTIETEARFAAPGISEYVAVFVQERPMKKNRKLLSRFVPYVEVVALEYFLTVDTRKNN